MSDFGIWVDYWLKESAVKKNNSERIKQIFGELKSKLGS